jgi:hypothetical protein
MVPWTGGEAIEPKPKAATGAMRRVSAAANAMRFMNFSLRVDLPVEEAAICSLPL